MSNLQPLIVPFNVEGIPEGVLPTIYVELMSAQTCTAGDLNANNKPTPAALAKFRDMPIASDFDRSSFMYGLVLQASNWMSRNQSKFTSKDYAKYIMCLSTQQMKLSQMMASQTGSSSGGSSNGSPIQKQRQHKSIPQPKPAAAAVNKSNCKPATQKRKAVEVYIDSSSDDDSSCSDDDSNSDDDSGSDDDSSSDDDSCVDGFCPLVRKPLKKKQKTTGATKKSKSKSPEKKKKIKKPANKKKCSSPTKPKKNKCSGGKCGKKDSYYGFDKPMIGKDGRFIG